MAQLVFIHGPGAGGCADAFVNQLKHFPGSVAPTLPGHLQGEPHMMDVARLTEWVRGWLWAQGLNKDLVLVGFTLGACIAFQYGLDYPDEVKGIVGTTCAVRPKGRLPETFEMRLRATQTKEGYEEWLNFQRSVLFLTEPTLREHLIECHRKVGPMAQHYDRLAIAAFDVRERIATLKPKLMLLRGLKDPDNPPEFEKEIHDAVPGSLYFKLPEAGHFPLTELPEETNALIERFLATL